MEIGYIWPVIDALGKVANEERRKCMVGVLCDILGMDGAIYMLEAQVANVPEDQKQKLKDAADFLKKGREASAKAGKESVPK